MLNKLFTITKMLMLIVFMIFGQNVFAQDITNTLSASGNFVVKNS